MRGKLQFFVLVLLLAPSISFSLLSNEELCESSGFTWLEESDYPATYSFTNDFPGSNPTGWVFNSISSTSVTVESVISGHSKVMKIYDASTTSTYLYVNQSFVSPRTNGTVEFWVYKESGTSCLYITFRDASHAVGPHIAMDCNNDGQFQYYNGASWVAFGKSFYADSKWIPVRIDFNSLTDTFDMYLDNILVLSNANYYGSAGDIAKILFATDTSLIGTFYVDALGYSWDSNYHISDNLMGGCCGDEVVDLREGLVSEYHFDESSGSNLPDNIGGHDGVLYNMEDNDWVSGRYGNSLIFDGSNEYVLTTLDMTLVWSVGSPVHVSAWFKTNSTSGMILAGTPGGGPDFAVTMVTGGFVRVRLYGGVTADSDSAVNDGEWHHVAYGTDGVSSYFYVDGVKQSSSPGIGDYNRETGVMFGARKTPAQDFYQGLVDEVRFYNRGLTDREVEYSYESSDYYPKTDAFTSSYSGYCYLNEYYQDLDDSAGSCNSKSYTYLNREDWWNTAWKHRKNITITENSGSNLTDYQVSINPLTYNNTGLVASYHFTEESSRVKDYSGNNNQGFLYSSTRALWHFDEGSGTSAFDDCLNNRDGTLNGMEITDWVTGVSGTALDFDGTASEYVRVYDHSSIDITSKITISAWINPDAYTDGGTGGGAMIVAKPGAYYLEITETSGVLRSYFYGLSSPGYHNAYTSVPLNGWSHVAVTYNGSHIVMYLNGKVDRILAVTGSITNSAGDLYIGGYSSGDYQFDGTIDEAAVYDIALSPEEIESLYYAQRAEFIEYAEGYEIKGVGLSFDGVDDYVDFGDVLDSTVAGAGKKFTISSWVKFSGSNTYSIIGKLDGSNDGFYFRRLSSGVLQFAADRPSVSQYNRALGSTTLSNEEWYHVVALWDATASSNARISMYVNGVPESITYQNTNDITIPDVSASLHLGERGSGIDYFNGVIDEVRIYNRLLNSVEINDVYYESKGRADYADIRFVDSSGDELKYYQEFDNKFWVKIPYLEASSSRNISMYYGNDYANSKSSGASTFVLFEDFNNGLLDSTKWVNNQGNGFTIIERNQELRISGTGSANGGPYDNYVKSVLNFNTGYVLEVSVKQASGTGTGRTTSIGFFKDTDNYVDWSQRIWTSPAVNALGDYYLENTGSWSEGVLDDTDVDNKWHKMKLEYNRSVGNFSFYRDDAYYGSVSNSGLQSGNVYATLSSWIRLTSETMDSRYDNLFIREYTSTEPTIIHHANETVYGINSDLLSYYSFDSDIENSVNDSVGVNHGVFYGFTGGLWHLDENTGSTVYDSSSYNHDGSLQNMESTDWVTGVSSTGLSFDGSNEWINLGNDLFSDSDFDATGGTISAWVKPTASLSDRDHVVGIEGRFTIEECFDSVNNWCATMFDGSDTLTATSLNPIVQGEWVHLVATWNTTHLILYVNGTFQAATLQDGPALNAVSRPVTIAAYYDGTLYYTIPAVIDEVTILTRSVNAEEVKLLYESQKAEFINYDPGRNIKGLKFEGVKEFVSIPDSSSLDFSSSFSASFWMRLNSSFSTSAGTYMGLLDKGGSYQLFLDDSDGKLKYSLDDSASTSWAQSADFPEQRVLSLAVFNNTLFAGMTSASTAAIYAFDGSTWTSSLTGAGLFGISMEVFNDKLYASICCTQKVYSYNGSWSEVFTIPDASVQPYPLQVYNGKLYIGSDRSGKVYVYNGTSLSTAFTIPQDAPVDMVVYNGKLYIASQGADAGDAEVYVYDGNTWSLVYDPGFNYAQSMAVYNGKLYVGFYNGAYVRSYDGSTWTQICDMGGAQVLSMAVYNGKLYIGSADSGRVYVYDGSTCSINYSPAQSYVEAMAVYNGRLYVGTGNNGIVYVYGNNQVLPSSRNSWDDDWHHVVSTYNGSAMNLYVDGVLDSSKTASFTIEMNNLPLYIGKTYGSQVACGSSAEIFNGVIDDLRFYNRALTSDDVSELYSVSDYGCCGDDYYIDTFYNGSLSATQDFCYYGLYVNQSLDTNNTLCNFYEYDWFTGTTGGSNDACCGDDNLNDDFYNNTLSNSSYFCLDGSIVSGVTSDTNQTICEWFSNSWFTGDINYPGVYSFTTDAVGSNPFNWTLDEAGGDIKVVDNLEGHSKVLYVHYDTGSVTAFVPSFSAQTNGTIEFWWRMEDTTQRSKLEVTDNLFANCVNLRIDSDQLQYRDRSSLWQNIMAVSDNTWYHVRVIFDCASDTFNIWVDNAEVGTGLDFYVVCDSITSFNFDGVSGTAYFDAVGYSWDANYSIGDNYDLTPCCGDDLIKDMFSNGSISNTTSFCHYGLYINHGIDVDNPLCSYYGFDYLLGSGGGTNNYCCGDDFFDDDFYNGTIGNTSSFCQDGLLINKFIDENSTICKEYSYTWFNNDVNYPGTYSFTDDAVGGNPSEWVVTETGGTINVISSLDGHNKVVELSDTNTDEVVMSNSFSEQNSGSVEFWLRIDDATNTNRVYIQDGDGLNGIVIGFGVTDYEISFYNGTWVDTGFGFNSNKWYHLRVDFNCSDNWHLIVNGESVDNNLGFTFRGSPVAIDSMNFRTSGSDNGFKQYVDAVGYSWDTDYEISTNQVPACCGDDAVDDVFYNGSISNTTSFCQEGVFIPQTIDANSSVCSYYGFDWLYGTTTGDYPYCCGDDSLSDDFYNDSNAFGSICYNGTYYFDSFDKSQSNCEAQNFTWFSGNINYPATYSFTTDTVGGNPSGWTVTETGGTVNVISSLSSHNKLVELHDTSSTYGVSFEQSINRVNGTVEAWLRSTINNNYALNWEFYEGATRVGLIQFRDSGKIIWYNGTIHEMASYAINTWYHIRVDFETSSNAYQGLYEDTVLIYINGVEYGPYSLENAPSIINKLWFGTASNTLNYYFYVDAVSYSWNNTVGLNSVPQCCGDDGNNDDFSNTTSYCISGEFFEEPDDYPEVCEGLGYDWLTGSIIGSGGPCCGDDGSEEFYNGTIGITTHFCHLGVYVHDSIDNQIDICEEYSYNWFTGLTTGDYPACCGDDGLTDDFYNGTVGVNATYCYNGAKTFDVDATQQSWCEANSSYNWFFGTLTGDYPPCCGDDNLDDDFYNNSMSCMNGTYYQCGVSDGVCPEDVDSMTCSISDPDCPEIIGTPDTTYSLCVNATTTWSWFPSHRVGESPNCCGNNGTSDDWLSNTDCCYNGNAMLNGNISNSLYCLNGYLYDCNNLVSDASVDTNKVTSDVVGAYYCDVNNSWVLISEGGGESTMDPIIPVGSFVSGESYSGAISFTIHNPTSDYQTYELELTYDRGYSHFTATESDSMTVTVPPKSTFTNYIDVYPVLAGEVTYTLTMTNANDPTDYLVRQFSIMVATPIISEEGFDVYSFDEVSIFELVVKFLNQFFVI